MWNRERVESGMRDAGVYHPGFTDARYAQSDPYAAAGNGRPEAKCAKCA